MRVLKISTLMLACAAGALTLSLARAEPGEHGGPMAHFEHMCADQGAAEHFAEMQKHRSEHMAEYLQLTEAQKAAFKDLQDVRAKTHADARAALCANKPDLSTFEKKLAFREAMMQGRLDAFKAEEPKLIAFFNSLDAGQKREFGHMLQHMKQRMMEGGMMQGGMMQGGMMQGGMMERGEGHHGGHEGPGPHPDGEDFGDE